MLGRIIDRLPDRAIDRILTADNWEFGYCVSDSGNRCFIGHVEDYIRRDVYMPTIKSTHNLPVPRDAIIQQLGIYYGRQRIGTSLTAGWFDALCLRFGTDRVVRLIKDRAAKRTQVDLGASDPVAEVQSGLVGELQPA